MEDALEKEKRARVEQDKARSPFYQPLHLAIVAKKLDHFCTKLIILHNKTVQIFFFEKIAIRMIGEIYHRRKIESDLKLAQSSIEAIERNKKEVEASLVR